MNTITSTLCSQWNFLLPVETTKKQKGVFDELFSAVERGDIHEAKRLLLLDVTPNSKDAKGNFLLDSALKPFFSQNADIDAAYDMVELLVSHGNFSVSFKNHMNIFEAAFGLKNFSLLYILHRYFRASFPNFLVSLCVLKEFLISSTLQQFEFVIKYYPELQTQVFSCVFSFHFQILFTIYKKCQELLVENISSYRI
jgi:hypothetical protein